MKFRENRAHKERQLFSKNVHKKEERERKNFPDINDLIFYFLFAIIIGCQKSKIQKFLLQFFAAQNSSKKDALVVVCQRPIF